MSAFGGKADSDQPLLYQSRFMSTRLDHRRRKLALKEAIRLKACLQRFPYLLTRVVYSKACSGSALHNANTKMRTKLLNGLHAKKDAWRDVGLSAT
jgi:hypothetical protein